MSSNPQSQQFSLLSFLANYPIQILGLLLVGLLLRNKFRAGLSSLPGPQLAAYTGLWRAWDVARGQTHDTAIALHRKYGSVVRVGPKHVSLSDESLIGIIYGGGLGGTSSKTNSDGGIGITGGANGSAAFTKTGFYPLQAITWKRKPAMNLFSTRDVAEHRAAKRKVGAAYTFPNLLACEAGIDSCVELLMKKLNGFAERGEKVDLGAWLEYFAFDAAGELSYASKMGFLEKGEDIEGMMTEGRVMHVYFAVIGQLPFLHRFLLGNPLIGRLMRPMEEWNPVVVHTLNAINGFNDALKKGENTGDKRHDMLARWASVPDSDPQKMSLQALVINISTNIFAGTDTTGGALGATIYHLCRHPVTKQRLVAEIDAAAAAGKIGSPAAYKDASTNLPFLTAVIKESIRLHSPVGMMLERHVPASGLVVPDGNGGSYQIPAGTIVGINPWVTNRCPRIFPDPDSFRPERWIEVDADALKEMDALFEFNFGAGSRRCLGRNVSWIEMHKALAQLLREFDVELDDPKKECTIKNWWFVFQEGVVCQLKRR